MIDLAQSMQPLRNVWRNLSRRPRLAVLATGLVALTLSAAITAIRVPVPRNHDEFSYLLASDTYSQGRLANAPHPMWVHFETFHVLQQPTYASKYPPVQGFFLALGQRLFGHPIVGVWISGALAAAACCWMFQGWVPGRFALLGAVLVAFHHCLQFYWQNYWNGSAAILGGALLFGALPRILRRPGPGNALVLALGVALLANSRPFEGFIASLPVAGVLVVHALGRRRASLAAFAGKVAVPALLVFSIVGAGMAYNNFRVTGDPLTLPYQTHSDQYLHTPSFLWQKPRPVPDYRHDVMRNFYLEWQAEGYHAQQSLLDALEYKQKNVYFFLTPLLLIPLVTIPWMLRSRRTRFVVGTAVFVFASSLTVSGTHAHYLAPIAPLLFLLVIQGLRQIRLWRWRGRAWGPPLVVAFAVAQVLIFVAAFVLYAFQTPTEWAAHRARIEAQLERETGRHLVIVHYELDHSPHEEWVSNAANIDGAKIVWARTLGPEQDRALLDYFEGRRLWNLRPDDEPPRLVEQGHAGGERAGPPS